MWVVHFVLAWIERHSGLASWLQAFGTILVVYVGIFAARSDEKKRERRALVQSVHLAAQQCGHAGFIADCAQAWTGELLVSKSKETLNYMQTVSFNINELPFGELEKYTSDFQGWVGYLQAAIEALELAIRGKVEVEGEEANAISGSKTATRDVEPDKFDENVKTALQISSENLDTVYNALIKVKDDLKGFPKKLRRPPVTKKTSKQARA